MLNPIRLRLFTAASALPSSLPLKDARYFPISRLWAARNSSLVGSGRGKRSDQGGGSLRRDCSLLLKKKLLYRDFLSGRLSHVVSMRAASRMARGWTSCHSPGMRRVCGEARR